MHDDSEDIKEARVKKQEITLMTLLAREATKEARDLLKIEGKKEAVDYKDLEQKLNSLYVSTSDKAALEKKLADIHPHKDWLIRTLKLAPVQEKKEENKINSNFDSKHECTCDCDKCKTSSFDAQGTSQVIKQNNNQLVALVAITALGLYFLKTS